MSILSLAFLMHGSSLLRPKRQLRRREEEEDAAAAAVAAIVMSSSPHIVNLRNNASHASERARFVHTYISCQISTLRRTLWRLVGRPT